MSETTINYGENNVTPDSSESDIWDEIIDYIVDIIAGLVPPPLETLFMEYVSEGGNFMLTSDGEPIVLSPLHEEAIISKDHGILKLCGIENPVLDWSIAHTV